MRYAILLYYIALWCVLNGGKAARSAVSPDILANFAKNVASVLSPAILGDIQSRSNRSSFQSTLTAPASLNSDDLNSHSILDNIVDKTSNAVTYYEPRSYPYNELYKDSPGRFEETGSNERLEESLRDRSYLRQEQPSFYRSYDFSANNENLDATPKSTDNIESSIQESPTSLYSSYDGADFAKAVFPHGPFLGKPYGVFHGFGHPYGHGYHHHHHHHHHHPYGGESDETNSEENARQETNATNHRGYGPPYFHHPFSPFPYGGHDSFYGPHQRNGNHSGNERNGYGYGHGPYHGGSGFYGPPGYGYNGNNNDNINSRQTEAAENDNQSNMTKNGYSPPYGPPWVKPLLGTFHLHGFPSPFNLLPYDHFHGVFKGGPVVGVGHVGYPIFADPYLGFPFHPYGPLFHGKKYLPPKDKPDSGESAEATEAPAGELSENDNPERITALNNEEVAPASSSNRYKTARKELKRLLANLENRRV
ncbi:hypothetical protein P5V15_013590 [Pogonomyrmex californicus]